LGTGAHSRLRAKGSFDIRQARRACGVGHVYAEEIDMMLKVTIGFALALIVSGIGMFLWTGSSSPTALVPTIFGGLLFVTGLFGLHERFSKRAMHAAQLITLLGFLGALVSLFLRGDVATHEALGGQDHHGSPLRGAAGASHQVMFPS
jgi:hypothetical protein